MRGAACVIARGRKSCCGGEPGDGISSHDLSDAAVPSPAGVDSVADTTWIDSADSDPARSQQDDERRRFRQGSSWTDDLVWHHGSHAVDSALWLLDDQLMWRLSALAITAWGYQWTLGLYSEPRRDRWQLSALSYNASEPSTDFMVISVGGTYRYERGTLNCGARHLGSFDEAVVFTDAVRRQDAAFVEGVPRPAFPGFPKAGGGTGGHQRRPPCCREPGEVSVCQSVHAVNRGTGP